MKNIITIIALLIGATTFAQDFRIVKFEEKLNDTDARLFPKKDRNDRTCALVKIETTRKLREFTFDGAAASEQKNGELWVYLQPGERYFTIRHETQGIIIRDYPFGEPLKEATVYVMKLESGNVNDVALQYFEVACAVDGATISIDNAEPKLFIDGKFSELLKYGKHQYTIEAPMYHPLRGITEITAKKQPPLPATLQPAFGKILVNTQPEQGADVFVDGEKRGQSPLTLDKIRSGEHTVRVVKTFYLPADEKTTISDGQTTTVNIAMKPNFAAITFNADGDIYINDEYKATGTWPGRLAPGVYKVEVRKSSHRSSLTTIEAKAGETRTMELEAPVPIYGALNITTNITAQIFIDDKPLGETTPYLMNQVLVGSHPIELRANGYQPYKQTVEIQEGKITDIQPVLQKMTAIRTTPGCVASNINLGKIEFVSSKTWKFGDQTWSAPVTAAYCNKTTFDGGTEGKYKSDCRKHPESEYGHLFSWCMVANYAAQLCPSPWRAPTKADFEHLAKYTNGKELSGIWGRSGLAVGSDLLYVSERAYYWSSTEYSSNTNRAYYLAYYSGNLYVSNAGKYYGFQVRCVK